MNNFASPKVQYERPVHGSLDYGELERLGFHPSEIIDFSVNSNPYGPSPQVHEAISHVPIDRYPDRECLQLRRAILEYELAGMNLSLSSLLCGNGAAELIWAIAHAYLKPGTQAYTIGPTFGEYRVASQAAGATVFEYCTGEKHFQPDIATICSDIQRSQPGIVWVCNPNNPTGIWLEQQQLASLHTTCQSVGALLVIDESYKHFLFPSKTGSVVEWLGKEGNREVLLLHSLTKAYALAGLRSGYAISSPHIIERLRAQLPSWNVNSVAQAASVAALQDQHYLHMTLKALAHESMAFIQSLRHAGFSPLPSQTHFFLLHVGDARSVRQELLARKILVRDCTSFGLPQLIRVATRAANEWHIFVDCLQEVVQCMQRH